ncbi:MAG: GAF domain-containing protein [Anaerolineaceae bacterium]|nr:GAF domain-containing protein [Anaerolineaceae bacterium]
MEETIQIPKADNIIHAFQKELQVITADEQIPVAVRLQLQKLLESFSGIMDLINKLDSQTRLLLGVVETSRIINSTLQIDQVLEQVMDKIIQITGAERCFLTLMDDKGEHEIRIARNWEKESLESSEIQFSRTIIEQVIEQCQPVVTTNAQMDERFAEQQSVMMYQLRSILCVPFLARETCIGAIYAENRVRSGIFTDALLESLVPFANQAAVAIENAKLFQQIQTSLAEVKSLKQTMDNVFASITSGVITTDEQLLITMQNKSSETIIGKKNVDIYHQTIDKALQASQSISAYFEKVLKNQEVITGMEMQIENPLQGMRDVRISISPLKDENSNLMGTAMVLEDLTEQKRMQAKNALFERMVSPAVIDQLQENEIETGGEQKTISVLFADVRGFTAYSERHTPEELVFVLNQYLAAAANAILEEGGTIDKFLGDAVMAWFNAPIPQENHILRAVRSALAIKNVVNRLNQSIDETDQLSFGIGVHSGEAVLGLIGAKTRMDFTAIGDCVNTARRIQEHAAPGQILISDYVKTSLDAVVDATPQEKFFAKGKNEPLQVFELIALSPWGTP